VNGGDSLQFDSEEFRRRVAGETVAVCEKHYLNTFARLNALDAKAQATTAIAGIFLSATAAYLTRGFMARGHHDVFPVLALTAVGSALASLLLAVLTITLKSAPGPYASEAIFEATSDLIQTPAAELTQTVAVNFYMRQASDWLKVTTAMERMLARKAMFLTTAHAMLAIAAIATGLVAGAAINLP
jgi:hypothetical protein